jgi:hypothetical protein
MRGILAVVMGMLCINAYTQEKVGERLEENHHKWYITWGYNRTFYEESDITFAGDGYAFVLHNMKAEDMPEAFSVPGYFSLKSWSVPQFNFRLGYYLNESTSVSVGTDHMKYHLIQTQDARISGFIDPSYAQDSSMLAYTGSFSNDHFLYREEFMNFHHSNGFNFIRVALEKRASVWTSRRKKCQLALTGGLSGGVLLPWTDFTFFGKNYKNKLHVSGWGVSANAGFRFEFARFLFLQGNIQVGHSALGDILLEDDAPSRAKQKIRFLERSWGLGAYFGKKQVKKKAAYDGGF